MPNNELCIIDNFASPKGIVALMEINDYIYCNDDDHDNVHYDIGIAIELILPELWPKPQSQ